MPQKAKVVGQKKTKADPTLKKPLKTKKKSTPKQALKPDTQDKKDPVLLLTEVAPEEPERPKIKEQPKAAPNKSAPQKISKPEKKAKGPVIGGGDQLKKGPSGEGADIGIERSPEIDAALEDLVRSMLKEMLKDYLDKHMAEIVKKVTAEEVLKMKKNNDS